MNKLILNITNYYFNSFERLDPLAANCTIKNIELASFIEIHSLVLVAIVIDLTTTWYKKYNNLHGFAAKPGNVQNYCECKNRNDECSHLEALVQASAFEVSIHFVFKNTVYHIKRFGIRT